MTRPLRLYGHRGASGVAPENTIVSFAQALSDGASALELDVHRTKDGEIVVVHDDDGRRMANDGRAIDALTLEQVRGLDVGWGFVDDTGARPFAGRGLHPPLLRDVLKAFPGVAVNVDLKRGDAGVREGTIAVVEACGAVDRVLLTAFSDDVIDAVVALGWRGQTGLAKNAVRALRLLPLVLARRALKRHVARGKSRLQIPPQAGGVRLDAAWFIDRAHDLGFAVDYWVINDLAQAKVLVERGADGLMSDHPARLRGLVPSPLSVATPT